MSIKIQIEKTVKISGAIFTYKKLPFLEQKRILLKYTEKGKFKDEDSLNMGYEMMEKMITGWSDVIDEDKNPVEFNVEIIKYFDVEMALEFMEKTILQSLKKIDAEARRKVKKGKKKRIKNKEIENLK